MINQSGGAGKVQIEAEQMFASFKAEHLLTPDELDRFPAFSTMSTQFVTVNITVTPPTIEKEGVIVVSYGTHTQSEYIYIYQDHRTNLATLPTGASLVHPGIFVSKKSD